MLDQNAGPVWSDQAAAIAETSDAATAYPSTGAQTATYNNLNQLTDLSGQALTWDADGNLLSDGARSYSWDAENRLVGITYPGTPGKATAFAYDGLDRRTAIARTPAGGGSAVTTSYLWCGSTICQARDAGNDVTREYYAEGELVPGVSPASYYYGSDQIGSVRRVFASASSAPAYSYGPYGVPLQATASLTDFTYAGMFHDADSGLDLTRYRAYDPVAGRWLSRDPLGEVSDPVGNLYLYVGGNPISIADALGLCGDDSFWSKVLQILAANPLLIPEIVGTEIVGGGPEDPAADIAVLAEIGAAERAAQIASTLGSTQRFVTIGVTDTAEGIRIISSSENALRPAALNALQEGEIAVTGAGHAEVTGVNAARELGLTPTGTAASRPICTDCAQFLQDQGVTPLSPLK